jgi:hypothetical protein
MSIRIISSGSIEGRPTSLKVRTQVCANLGQVDEPVDLSQQMIVGHMPLKAKAVKQRLLHHPPLAHHRPNLLIQTEENQRPAAPSSGVFQRNSSTPAVRFAQKGDVHAAPRMSKNRQLARTRVAAGDSQ